MDKTDYRNILALWLGSYVATKRKRHGVAFDDLSNNLKLSPQYIRMAENGLASISPGRVFDLISGLQQSFELDASYTAVSALLVATQSIPAQGNYIEIEAALDRLQTTDNKALAKLLSHLDERILFLLKEENYNELKEEFSSRELVNAMESYLTKPSYGMVGKFKLEKEWEDDYKKVPSFWNDHFSDELKQLTKHLLFISTNMPYYNIVHWERKNLSNVKRFSGVVNSIRVLIRYIEHYDWKDYFDKNISFKIYLPDASVKRNSPEVAEFFSEMSRIYKVPLERLHASIKLAGLTHQKMDAIKKTLEIKERPPEIKTDDKDFEDYFDCWIYDFKEDESKIGFVFDSNDRAYYDFKNMHALKELDMENQVNRYRNLNNLQIRELCEKLGEANEED
jgi:transcriptional regulator with XRE-family HTH domain